MRHASAPRSSAAMKSAIERPPTSSSPSQATRTCTGNAPPCASCPTPFSSEYSCPLSSGHAAGVEDAITDGRLERSALPKLERIRRLHVNVPVDEDGRCLSSARGRHLTHYQRSSAVPEDGALAAGAADEV